MVLVRLDSYHHFWGPLSLYRHPLKFARFGLHALRSACGLAKGLFKGSSPALSLQACQPMPCCPLDQPQVNSSDR
jgi:hypothetical protein